MIDLYTWKTPNGRKPAIMLEEIGLPYTLRPVDLGKGEQKSPSYLAINPNGKIPAMVDHDAAGGKPIAVFESGAILMYLAEKTGRFMPADTAGRYEVIEWLMFQMAGIGPTFGQAFFFASKASEYPAAVVERFTKERERIFGVLESRLSESEFLAGEYSIADIASYPWVAPQPAEILAAFPSVANWVATVGARPAVRKGMHILTPP